MCHCVIRWNFPFLSSKSTCHCVMKWNFPFLSSKWMCHCVIRWNFPVFKMNVSLCHELKFFFSILKINVSLCHNMKFSFPVFKVSVSLCHELKNSKISVFLCFWFMSYLLNVAKCKNTHRKKIRQMNYRTSYNRSRGSYCIFEVLGAATIWGQPL